MNTTATPKILAQQVRSAVARLLETSGRDWLVWARVLRSDTPNTIALRRWIGEGDTLYTLQAHKSGRVWAPGPRMVTHKGSCFFQLNESRRDFSDLICIGANDGVWIGWDDGSQTLVAYSKDLR